jgi:hypothetical protein
MNRFPRVFLVMSFLSLSIAASAQKNELGLVFGGVLSPKGTSVGCPLLPPVNPAPACNTGSLTTDPVLGVEGVYSRQIVSFRIAALHVEFPIMATPERIVQRSPLSTRYSSLFFTPSLKLKFSAPGLSPWLSAGGGFVHFSPKGGSSSNQGAFQMGAGVDIKTPLPVLGIRLEGRDYFTGRFINSSSDSQSHHNVFLGGGVVLRF